MEGELFRLGICNMENIEDKINEDLFNNKWVAQLSFQNKKIITYGEDPSAVLEEARKKGVQDPVIYFWSNNQFCYTIH